MESLPFQDAVPGFLSKFYSDPVTCYLRWLRGKETLQDVPAWLRYRQALHSVNTLRVA